MATPKQVRTRGRLSLVLGAILATVLFAAVAYADNVQNDVVVGGSDTIVAGGSTTINYRITANNGDGQTGCNAADSSPAMVTINAPAAVSASPASLSFTSCSTNQSVDFSSSTAGDYEITVSVSDSGTGTYNVNPAKFTLHVTPPPPPSDTTAPDISYTLNPASPNGNNAWYTSDVTLTWQVSEPESPSSLVKTGCVDQNITADQAATTYSCAATSDGGSAGPVSVSIKRDATDPTITAARNPDANGFGWNNSDVSVDFTCDDATSGVSGVCGPDVTVSAEGANQSVTGNVADAAGNTASATVNNINIDLTNPSVSLVGGPADGASYYFGSVPAAPTCSASDALSGLDGACSVSGYSAAVGTHTVSASAADKAGNVGTDSVTYTVLAWTLFGFYQPVDMGSGVVNTVKNGSTVPLKFEVFAGPTELTDPAVVQTLAAQQVSCTAFSGDALDDIEVTATGGTALRYDSTGGQFIYNWQTPKKAGYCYRVTMTTDDGSSLTAQFKLK